MFNATPLFRLFAKRRTARLNKLDPVAAQRSQLLNLLRKAQNTKFGREYDFSRINSVKEFQSRVPLRRYEDFWNEYWKDEFPRVDNITWPGLYDFYAVSSGTSTGTTKYIPITHEMLESNKKAGLDLLSWHLINKPNSQIFNGKNFMLGGSTALVEESPGIFSGDLSGLSALEMPWWIKPWYFPPAELALTSDWEEKIDKMGKQSLKESITMLGGVPSWLLIFIDKLSLMVDKYDGSLKSIYPELELLIHGGVNFAPYYDQFKKLLEGTDIDLREVYPASEGFIAVGDRGYHEGLRLMLDSELFFEFVPLEELDSPNPTRHWIEDVELDLNYAVIMSTCSGLWSYVIGDTVKFVDRETPRLLVTGRTSYYLSAFGEHLIDEEIEDAISSAARQIGQSVTDYSVGPLYPSTPAELGGHLYVIEFSEEPPNGNAVETFASEVDKVLCQRNEDYDAHRAEGFGLNSPKIFPVKPGTFAAWMKKRGKLGGQNKVPRIITNQELFDDLRSFVGEK